MEKTPVKDIIKSLDYSRSTIYRTIKILGIKLIKVKGLSYISDEDCLTLTQELSGESTSKSEKNDTTNDTTVEQVKNIYLEQITELKKDLEEEREKRVQGAFQAGQYKTRAEQAEEKLLMLESINVSEKKSWWEKKIF